MKVGSHQTSRFRILCREHLQDVLAETALMYLLCENSCREACHRRENQLRTKLEGRVCVGGLGWGFGENFYLNCWHMGKLALILALYGIASILAPGNAM